MHAETSDPMLKLLTQNAETFLPKLLALDTVSIAIYKLIKFP
jgi:hypothetical protein